jgi:IS30 family transposase
MTRKTRATKLTEENVRDILSMLERKIPQRQIAQKFDVSQMTISKINTRELWANIDRKERFTITNIVGKKIQI